ncbi:putative RNA-directed DNA polymerase from transposon X-element, partial [Stegodyphus mimosarum]
MGSTYQSEKEVANLMADELEKIFQPLQNNNSPHETEIIEEYQKIINSTPRNLIRPTSPTEIKEIIKNLKKRKAKGYDNINNEALKALPTKGIIKITNIINACIRKCYFPQPWKHSIITSILKPGKNPKDIKSYRPISLLPAMGKIYEKILCSRLTTHLEKYNLIDNNQFGFRSGHSTTHQILNLVEIISLAFQKKNSIAACFLDFEKAFDRVWHIGLIFKLQKFMLPDGLIHIIISFLKNRTFQVRIGDTLSK